MNETDDVSDTAYNYIRAYNVEKLLICAVALLVVWRIIVFIQYKVASKSSKLVGSLTRTPTIPFSTSKLYEYKEGNYTTNVIPQVKIMCSDSRKKYCTSKKIINLIKELFNIEARASDDHRTKLGKMRPIPKNARVVSIKMSGFKHGNKIQEFIPIDGILDGSRFTYQMFGLNRIQVTNYVENGVSYVAGFCIYFDKPGLLDNEFPTEVIKKAWYSVQKYAGRRHVPILNVEQTDETVGLLIQKLQLKVVHCPRLNTNVISCVKQGFVTHQESNELNGEKTMKKCMECSGHQVAPPAYTPTDNN